MDDWNSASDEEILELLSENYYVLASTGEDAVLAFTDDIVNDRLSEFHGLSDERCGLLLVKFARLLRDKMNTPASL